MKEKKKVFLSILMMMLLILSATTTAFAAEIPQMANASEYNSIMNYAALSESQMRNSGYSDEEIEGITQYKEEYAKKILEYSKKTSEELSQEGFSEVQIQAFDKLKQKNIDLKSDATSDEINAFLQENVTRGLTGSVTMTVERDAFLKGRNTFKATWTWSGRPLVTGFHDTVAFGWTNGHTLESYKDLVVTLKCDSKASPTYSVPDKDKDAPVPDQGVRFKFPTASPGGWLYDKGVCFFTLANDDNSSKITISWKYAHGTLTSNGFGISISGPSLNISTGNTQMANGLKTFTGLK